MFNKISTLNTHKACGVKPACLSMFLTVMVLVLFTSVVNAQSNDFSSRLNRMENEIETLNRAIYKGEKPPIQNYNVTNDNSNSTAQMEIRLQQIETQMRELTGRIEEKIYTINQLKQDVSNLQSSQMSEASTPRKKEFGAGQLPDNARFNDNNNQDLQLDWKDQQDESNKMAAMQTNISSASTGDATAMYESAYASLKNKDYMTARGKFEGFLSKHPNHVLSANSKYWLGETYYVEGEYAQSARIFAQGFQTFPDSAKSPDMLLKLGLSLSNTGKKEEACIALSQLPVRFKAGPQNILDRGVDEMDKLGCSI